MNNFSLLLGLLFTFSSLSMAAQPAQFRVAFYNVENLFDLEDDPITLDEDFTPEGKQQWTSERYETKLDRIAQVIEGLTFPAVMGFCEIENNKVLTAIAVQQRLTGYTYGAISFDSPDLRGIDVGLLYNKNDFELISSRPIGVEFPLWLEPEGYTSRDILYVQLKHRQSGEMFHFFVNHWPSRRGGAEASEHRRVWVASHLRREVDVILAANPLEKIIIMGDFNDEPGNTSITSGLGTLKVGAGQQLPGVLYNPFATINSEEEGSYNYQGNWNVLDQIIYTGLQMPNDWELKEFGIFKRDWLLYEGKSPNRTYGGPNYYGGYSDHLPVFMDVVRKE
jgi:predicted extracellular nuclease